MLWRPVRGAVVLKYSGQLALVLSAFTLVPTAATLLLGDTQLTPWYAGLALLFAGAGWGLARVPAPSDVHANEALVMPALSFVLVPIAYALPLVAAGTSPMDALFESVSGITTTGLSTLGSVAERPRSLLFIRAWQQWVGGLGIVVFALALFVAPGVAARRLGSESLSPEALLHSTGTHARRYLAVYLVLTALGIGVLLATGLGPFDAITHCLAAVSTGGFASHDESLAAFPHWLSRAAVIGVSLLGAISFTLYLPRDGWGIRRALRDAELRGLVGLGLGVAALLLVFELAAGVRPPGELLRELPLVAFSAQTTAGFTSLPVSELAPASKLVLIGAMAVGGDLGSTAGGIKLLRLLVLVRVVQAAVRRRSLPPHAVFRITLRGRPVEDAEALAALSLALLFLGVIGLCWLPFVACGYPALDALFEVTSATGTVGLSTGITRPELEAPLKGVLCAAMWLGRLEVLPLLVLLLPATWRGRGEGER